MLKRRPKLLAASVLPDGLAPSDEEGGCSDRGGHRRDDRYEAQAPCDRPTVVVVRLRRAESYEEFYVESEDSNVSNFDEPILLNTPLFDEDECFDPGGDIDEIDVFLAIDVPSDIMDAYNDSKGDVLEILHNTTHNLFLEVFLDHDPRSLKDEPDNDD
ncbi:hypothetical protein Tco_0579485 [Tanacetum coccineum]